MPWPKGVPRKGHVNKDGTKHAAKGEKKALRLAESVSKAIGTVPVGAMTPTTQTSVRIRVKPVPTETRAPQIKRRRYTVPVVKPYALTADECPQCRYPEAMGGYCPECGWSLPAPTLRPANSTQGKLFAR